jgi:hypothetical protein
MILASSLKWQNELNTFDAKMIYTHSSSIKWIYYITKLHGVLIQQR